MIGSQKGLTLIEVMVAMAILAIAGIMLLRTQGDGARLYEESSLRITGVFLAQQIMADLESQSIIAPGAAEETLPEPYEGFRYQLVVEETGLPGLLHTVLAVYYGDREMITIHAYQTFETSGQ